MHALLTKPNMAKLINSHDRAAKPPCPHTPQTPQRPALPLTRLDKAGDRQHPDEGSPAGRGVAGKTPTTQAARARPRAPARATRGKAARTPTARTRRCAATRRRAVPSAPGRAGASPSFLDGAQEVLGVLGLQCVEVADTALAVRNDEGGVSGGAQRPDELVGRLGRPHRAVGLVVVDGDEVAHPYVFERFENGDARSRVRLQHAGYQVLGRGGHDVPVLAVEPDPVVLAQIHRDDLLDREGQPAAQEQVHDDADGPHVDLLVVPLEREHLGRDVGHRPAGLRQELLGPAQRREAKVRQLDGGRLALVREQNVLRLDVAVDDAALVQVRHDLQQLADDAVRVRLGEAVPLVDQVVQLPAADELHHDVQRVAHVAHVLEVYHVLVPEEAEDGDLAAQQVALLAADLGLVHDLDGVLLARGLVDGPVDDAELPVAQLLADGVELHEALLLHGRRERLDPLEELRLGRHEELAPVQPVALVADAEAEHGRELAAGEGVEVAALEEDAAAGPRAVFVDVVVQQVVNQHVVALLPLVEALAALVHVPRQVGHLGQGARPVPGAGRPGPRVEGPVGRARILGPVPEARGLRHRDGGPDERPPVLPQQAQAGGARGGQHGRGRRVLALRLLHLLPVLLEQRHAHRPREVPLAYPALYEPRLLVLSGAVVAPDVDLVFDVERQRVLLLEAQRAHEERRVAAGARQIVPLEGQGHWRGAHPSRAARGRPPVGSGVGLPLGVARDVVDVLQELLADDLLERGRAVLEGLRLLAAGEEHAVHHPLRRLVLKRQIRALARVDAGRFRGDAGLLRAAAGAGAGALHQQPALRRAFEGVALQPPNLLVQVLRKHRQHQVVPVQPRLERVKVQAAVLGEPAVLHDLLGQHVQGGAVATRQPVLFDHRCGCDGGGDAILQRLHFYALRSIKRTRRTCSSVRRRVPIVDSDAWYLRLILRQARLRRKRNPRRRAPTRQRLLCIVVSGPGRV
ncbi:colanic acid biosynthesis glycosyltransferase WcaI [Babesia caballi]|uniref:Colanic acid biosynthesis glycosyltransferase WcaI n=1 Tax=Babesia caballi TaxID=5871 RepID=A0AAV4M098_BABCB|nr:colanic acid biosynthesis glycosyltransferase WcaI [Babesia caballi]